MLRALADRSKFSAIITGFSLVSGALLVFSLLPRAITIIPAGQVGVVDLLGQVSNDTLKPGFHLTNPLAKVVKFSIQTKEIKETVDTPTQEGLTVNLEVSILHRLEPEKAPQIYKTIGTDYVNVVLVPQFRSVIRSSTASFDAQSLYTSAREQLSAKIRADLTNLISPRGILVEETPLRKVSLPPTLQQAIEAKLKAEQESQQMQYILQKERQEAERKRIEAQGIADSQRIISQGLNDKVLEWRGIEATEKLSQSQNAKVVVIGAGKNGLPIILQPPSQ